MKWLWVLLVCGCGDSGTKGPAGQPAVFVQSDTQDASTIKAANFACLGTHTDPAGPTADTPVPMIVSDFELKTPVAGATVEAYYSADHFSAKTPDATSTPTGADGKTSLTIGGGAPYRIIFRTVGNAQTIETIEFNRAYNDPARNSVSTSTKAEIPTILSVTTDDTKGVVAGDLRDCDNARVGGVTFAVSSSGGSFNAAGSTFYFLDATATQTLPVRAQKWTSGDGVFAALNVPPGNATVAASGILMTGGSAMQLGTGVAPVRAGSITVVQIEPLGP